MTEVAIDTPQGYRSVGTVASPIPQASTQSGGGTWCSTCSFCAEPIHSPRGGWVHVATGSTACAVPGMGVEGCPEGEG